MPLIVFLLLSQLYVFSFLKKLPFHGFITCALILISCIVLSYPFLLKSLLFPVLFLCLSVCVPLHFITVPHVTVCPELIIIIICICTTLGFTHKPEECLWHEIRGEPRSRLWMPFVLCRNKRRAGTRILDLC